MLFNLLQISPGINLHILAFQYIQMCHLGHLDLIVKCRPINYQGIKPHIAHDTIDTLYINTQKC